MLIDGSVTRGSFPVSFRDLKRQRLREKEQEPVRLQNGQKSRSPEEEEQQVDERIPGLDLSTWEDHSYGERERCLRRTSSPETQQDIRPSRGGGEEEEYLGTSLRDSLLPREHPEAPGGVVIRDRARALDELSQKTTRAKRESRRMRELEQAKFSLELLKVRATGGGASSPSEERRWSAELLPPTTPPLRSPQGTPDSQSSKCSFELLSLEEVPPRATIEELDLYESGSPELLDPPTELQPSPPRAATASPLAQKQPDHGIRPPCSPTLPPKIENYLPTFYVPTGESSSTAGRHPAKNSPPQRFVATAIASTATTAAITSPATVTSATVTSTTMVSKALKDRRSCRRPVVVVISMLKETPLSEELSTLFRPPVELRDEGAQTVGLTPSPQQPGPAPIDTVPTPAPVPAANLAVLEKLERLNEEKEERQRSQQQQNERQMMEEIRQQKEVLERQRLFFAQNKKEMFEKQRDETLLRIQQSRQGGTGTGLKGSGAASSSKPPRPSSLLFDRTQVLAPQTRAMSESTAPGELSSTGVDAQPSGPQPRPPLPPASYVPRERLGEGRPITDGWVPKLTLESRDGGRSGSPRFSPKKPTGSNQGSTVHMADKSGNIFFSPKDKVMLPK